MDGTFVTVTRVSLHLHYPSDLTMRSQWLFHLAGSCTLGRVELARLTRIMLRPWTIPDSSVQEPGRLRTGGAYTGPNGGRLCLRQ